MAREAYEPVGEATDAVDLFLHWAGHPGETQPEGLLGLAVPVVAVHQLLHQGLALLHRIKEL